MITIRSERPGEAETIRALIQRAFAPMAFADGDEQDLPERLREDGDLLLSLVADDDGEVVGQVTFSAATVGAEAGWVALGPISVLPERQRQGIGRSLVAEGLRRLAPDHRGVVLLGDPAVYGPMGFVSDGGMSWRDVRPQLLQFHAFAGTAPRGEVAFAPAFDA